MRGSAPPVGAAPSGFRCPRKFRTSFPSPQLNIRVSRISTSPGGKKQSNSSFGEARNSGQGETEEFVPQGTKTGFLQASAAARWVLRRGLPRECIRDTRPKGAASKAGCVKTVAQRRRAHTARRPGFCKHPRRHVGFCEGVSRGSVFEIHDRRERRARLRNVMARMPFLAYFLEVFQEVSAVLLCAEARILDQRGVVARSWAKAHSLAPPCLGHRPASTALCKKKQTAMGGRTRHKNRFSCLTSFLAKRSKKKRPSAVCETTEGRKKIPGAVLLSHSQLYSTIAAGVLNHRVREGNGCFNSAMSTGKNHNEEKCLSGCPARFETLAQTCCWKQFGLFS